MTKENKLICITKIDLYLLPLLLILISFIGCTNNKNSSEGEVSTNESMAKNVTNPLEDIMNSRHLDYVLDSLVVNKSISREVADIVKNKLCKYGTPSLTYNIAIELAQNYKSRVDSFKQYEKTITFPFQFGKNITIPQIIAFGKKKDVVVYEKYETVYLKDGVSGKNTKYSYQKHLGNDLHDLEMKYKEKAKFYKYNKDSKFLYKYRNWFSFDFRKNEINYETNFTTYGNDVIEWDVSCSKNLPEMYIKKYGEPICITSDSTYCLWDFKNIRLVITKKWLGSYKANFIEKTLYNEAEYHSIITREEAEKERKVKEEKAAQKAYEDSIRLIQARKNDL